MNQCLHITFSLVSSKNFLHDIVQKKARSLGIEGTAQSISGAEETGNTIKVIACGTKQALEDFLVVLHKEVAHGSIQDIAIEPTLKEKDFRGVFRVIE